MPAGVRVNPGRSFSGSAGDRSGAEPASVAAVAPAAQGRQNEALLAYPELPGPSGALAALAFALRQEEEAALGAG